MIEFLIAALILVVVIIVVKLVLGMLPIPSEVKTIIWLIIAVIILLWFLSSLGIYDVGKLGLRR